MQPNRLLLLLLVLSGLAWHIPATAETYHTCGTVIASAPAVINTQGVYCLTHDLTTSITSGPAIAIQANNVTIDCNGYKLGGLAGGINSSATGIHADSLRVNITVRNCGVRGYYYGIDLQGAGNLVEDNRLDGNLYLGIQVLGDHNRVQRNRVYDTGGFPTNANSYGIFAYADVIDNTVAGVFAEAVDSNSNGIDVRQDGAEIRGNQVRDLLVTGAGNATGIYVGAGGVTVRANSVSSSALTAGFGIFGSGATDTFCIGNTVHKFGTGIGSCQLGTDNLTN
jgi:parallel beta-helix repeat protein